MCHAASCNHSRRQKVETWHSSSVPSGVRQDARSGPSRRAPRCTHPTANSAMAPVSCRHWQVACASESGSEEFEDHVATDAPQSAAGQVRIDRPRLQKIIQFHVVDSDFATVFALHRPRRGPVTHAYDARCVQFSHSGPCPAGNCALSRLPQARSTGNCPLRWRCARVL